MTGRHDILMTLAVRQVCVSHVAGPMATDLLVHAGDDHVGVDDVALAGAGIVGVDGVGGRGNSVGGRCGMGTLALPVAGVGGEVRGLFDREIGDESGELVVDGGLEREGNHRF